MADLNHGDSCPAYGKEEEEKKVYPSDVAESVRRAQRKAEQLDILSGVITVFVVMFFGITACLELAGMPALAMALVLLVLVIAFFLIWAWRAKAHRDAAEMRHGQEYVD